MIAKHYPYLGYLVALLGFATDQLSKIGIIFLVPLNAIPRKITITPFMDFVHIRNDGISYGLFANGGEIVRWLLIAAGAGLVVICINWLQKAKTKLYAIAIGLIIGGGLGNIFDRLFHGAVVDFVSLHAFGFYWYVFNLADLWLTMGIALFFLTELERIRNE